MLSVVRGVYICIHTNRGRVTRLWSSVRAEPTAAMYMLPSMRVDLKRKWCDQVFCSDATPLHFARPSAHWNVSDVRRTGGLKGQWRFKLSGAEEHAPRLRAIEGVELIGDKFIRADDPSNVVATTPLLPAVKKEAVTNANWKKLLMGSFPENLRQHGM